MRFFACTTLRNGPIDLLPHWLKHYSALGVDFMSLTLLDTEIDRAAVELECMGYPVSIQTVSQWGDYVDSGPVNRSEPRKHGDDLIEEDIQPAHVKAMGGVEGEDWVIHADLDEFYEYPAAINTIAAFMGHNGSVAIHGHLVDRITADGSLPEAQRDPSIAEQYPIRCDLTSRVGRGWTQKIMLHLFGTKVGSGHHQAHGVNSAVWPVGLEQDYIAWHFKWRKSLVDRLEWGLKNSGNASTRWGQEATTFIQYIGADRKIPVTDYVLGCKHVGGYRPVVIPRTDR